MVGSFGVKITIRARQKDQFPNRKFFAKNNSMIPLRSEVMVLLYQIFFWNNINFLFHLVAQATLTLFTHIINHETTKVLIRDTSDWLLLIFC